MSEVRSLTSLSLDSRSLKWVKQGRGKGSGKDYQPWLTVRDLPSAGRSHRIWGFQTQRTHHLLSDLELAAFFLFDWNPSVTDIREQYPLRLEDTIELAAQARIRHPALAHTPPHSFRHDEVLALFCRETRSCARHSRKHFVMGTKKPPYGGFCLASKRGLQR